MSAFFPTAFPGPLKRGDRDANPSGPVHRLQGWLCLHGYACAVDGDFGPRTEHALLQFQERHVDDPDRFRVLCEATWQELTAPLARAMEPIQFPRIIPGTVGVEKPRLQDLVRAATIGETIALVARQWTSQSVGGGPLRELPGNSGPVVEACTRRLAERDRLPCFCGGTYQAHVLRKVGTCQQYAPDWRKAWCAGAVCTWVRQACDSLGVDMPIKGSLSCDVLARQARTSTAGASILIVGGTVTATMVTPGDLFLVRGAKPGDWVHCGVVLEVLPPVPLMTLEGRKYEGGLRTAEGNTNANGSRNGDRLLERVRPIAGNDYLCWRGA